MKLVMATPLIYERKLENEFLPAILYDKSVMKPMETEGSNIELVFF